MLSLETGAVLLGGELMPSALSGGQDELSPEVVLPAAAVVQEGTG